LVSAARRNNLLLANEEPAQFGAQGLGAFFGITPIFLREGDEARVVLVGAQERIGPTAVVRGPGVLQATLLHWPKVLQSS
jgi:hypothetical protein